MYQKKERGPVDMRRVSELIRLVVLQSQRFTDICLLSLFEFFKEVFSECR